MAWVCVEPTSTRPRPRTPCCAWGRSPPRAPSEAVRPGERRRPGLGRAGVKALYLLRHRGRPYKICGRGRGLVQEEDLTPCRGGRCPPHARPEETTTWGENKASVHLAEPRPAASPEMSVFCQCSFRVAGGSREIHFTHTLPHGNPRHHGSSCRDGGQRTLRGHGGRVRQGLLRPPRRPVL